MLYWYDVFVAYPNGDMVHLLHLLMSSEDDELCPVIIKFQRINVHQVSDFLNAMLYPEDTVILRWLHSGWPRLQNWGKSANHLQGDGKQCIWHIFDQAYECREWIRLDLTHCHVVHQTLDSCSLIWHLHLCLQLPLFVSDLWGMILTIKEQFPWFQSGSPDGSGGFCGLQCQKQMTNQIVLSM